MSQTTFSGPVASQNGFIENSFTTAARDAIANPTVGLLIYNTTTNTYQVYNGTSWQEAFGPASPTVVSIAPNISTYGGGNTAIITGTNFTSPATVAFGSNSATNVSVINTTAISATIPSRYFDGSVNVSVTTVDGTGTLVNGFTYYGTPTINSVYPNVIAQSGGTTILVRGSSFIPSTSVTFYDGSTPSSLAPTIINSTALTVVTPEQRYSSSGSIIVQNPAGSAAYYGLTFVGAPTINSVSPNSGTSAGGTAVTLSGTNFYAPISVNFGGTASSNVTITNSNVAVATAPAGTIGSTVSVSVTSVGGSNTKSSAYSYVYVAPGYTNTQGAAFPNLPIAVNPNGSLIAAMGNTNVMTYTLSTSWDVTTQSLSGTTTLPNVSNKTYESSCIAFNGNGTRMYTVARDNTTGQRHIVRYILDTPYNFSSYLAPGTAATANPIAGMFVDVVNQLFFSSDGMYGYIVTNGYLYQYNLSSPYNENDFTTSPAYGVPLNSLGVTPWGMNTPRVATITSDGNYMLFASAGSTYNGQLFRIPMSTPYSVASLASATTSDTYNYAVISGGYGPSYNGLAIGSADLNVLSTCANGGIAKFVLG